MKLFVYGTLKRGECNNDLLVQYGAKFVQQDKVANHGIYGIWPIAGVADGVTLEGEVWNNISAKLWKRLDLLEMGYNRKEAVTVDGHTVTLYLYRYIPKFALSPSPRWPITEG